MGYRIDPGQPTDVELRRLLVEQLGRAALMLRSKDGPDAEAVHDVRKRLKKSRSVLRLGRADLGASVVRHANAELRRVGADLAQQRDADSLVEAVDGLSPSPGADVGCESADPPTKATAVPRVHAQAGPLAKTTGVSQVQAGPRAKATGVPQVRVPGSAAGLPPVEAPGPEAAQALAVVRSALVERAEGVRDRGGLARTTVVGAARTLEQTVTWLRLVPAQATGWDALGPGFARQYQHGRKAFHALPEEPSVDELHEWRKRVKDLWYHQRLLRRLWTDAQRPIVAAADELAAILGDDHDLALLLAHLSPPVGGDAAHGSPVVDRSAGQQPAGQQPGGQEAADLRATVHPVSHLDLDPDVCRLVADLVDSRRQQLQARARKLGTLLYADDPAAWRARHGAWWQAASSAC